MCFFFDIRSPLTNPTKYLVMMDSREIWGVTTAHIFCTFARLFTLRMTFFPVFWITESVKYKTCINSLFIIECESISHTQKNMPSENMHWLKSKKNSCGNWDMTSFKLTLYIHSLRKAWILVERWINFFPLLRIWVQHTRQNWRQSTQEKQKRCV